MTEFRNSCLKVNNILNNEEIKVEEHSDFNIYTMLEFANSAGDYTTEIEKKTYKSETSAEYSDLYFSDQCLDDNIECYGDARSDKE